MQTREPPRALSSLTRTARRCAPQTLPFVPHTLTCHPQIHYISDSIRCCGAGTAADTEFTTALIASNIEMHALSTGRKPRVVTAMTMLKQMLFRCVLYASYPLTSAERN